MEPTIDEAIVTIARIEAAVNVISLERASDDHDLRKAAKEYLLQHFKIVSKPAE